MFRGKNENGAGTPSLQDVQREGLVSKLSTRSWQERIQNDYQWVMEEGAEDAEPVSVHFTRPGGACPWPVLAQVVAAFPRFGGQ